MKSIRAMLIAALTVVMVIFAGPFSGGSSPLALPEAGSVPLFSPDAGTTTTPLFSPAVFTGTSNNYSVALSGYAFGMQKPFKGDSAYFRLGDPTCGKVHPGECEAGYLGDAYTLDFKSWTNNQIQIGSYTVAVAGDAVEVGVWNPQEKSGPLAAVWGGNVPPLEAGTPQISNVILSGSGQSLNITILGSGFGSAPEGLPCTCDTAFLQFGDYAYHSFSPGGSSVSFRAGFTDESITLMYTSWSDTEIQISGFGSSYGQGGMVVNSGDPISLDVWSTSVSGLLATAWGGRGP